MISIIRFLALAIIFSATTLDIYGQPPRLNSYPSSPATVFLDFDGQSVKATSWNWAGGIDAQGSGLSNAAIIEVFNRVAEDYRPFNLNITTDSAVYFSAPFDRRIRIIITPTHEWYGQAGGVSYVSSFNWGNETPAWVFSNLLSYNPKYVAEVCSHEMGHTLGLQHQSVYDQNCVKIAEYDEGRGEGEIGWAPIMGIGYYKNLTTWNIGPNTEGCNNIQSDLYIIAGATNNFGFRDDDHGNNAGTSTKVLMNGFSFAVNGLINNPDDIDAFKLTINSTTNFKLTAVPQNVGWGNAGANIDIKIILQDARSNVIGVYNPELLLNVGIDTSLNPGDYYVLVSGTGNINQFSYGSLGYYNLVANIGVALPVRQFLLKANIRNGNHVLNWTYTADEAIKDLVVETSADGKDFHQLVTLNAESRTFSYRPFENNSYYRLKAVTATADRAYYSGISKIIPLGKVKAVQLMNSTVHQNIFCISDNRHTYRLYDAGGRLILRGVLIAGINSVDIASAPRGILLLHLSDGINNWTERVIKQ